MIISYLLKKRFPVNRFLTDEERQFWFNPKKRLDVEPLNCLATIKLNSTFLESVDYFCVWRGVAVTGGISLGILLAMGLFAILQLAINDSVKIQADLGKVIYYASYLVIALGIVMLTALIELAFSELFRKTHYPIRLNRKNRMVYVYRRNGTVLSVPWDDVFFMLNREKGAKTPMWDLRGHVLAKDGITVKETILFGYYSASKIASIQYWEYLRRYMEEGPKEAFEKTPYCLPIDDRREPPYVGLYRLLLNFKGAIVLQVCLFPVLLLFAIGRVIASYTSRIPVWPKEVEDTCALEPGDPYVRTWRMNPSWFALTPKE